MRREEHPSHPLGGWRLPAILGALVLLAACAPAPTEGAQEEAPSPADAAAEDGAAPDANAAGATPVPFPDGFDFPTDRATIEGWVADQDTAALDREIDQFDDPSIALKPTWYLVEETGLTSFPVWPGPPDPARSFPPTAWDTCVLVDPTN